MAFQFFCPQGHMLQGDDSQAGQPCQCPYCGVAFVAPSGGPQQTPPSDQSGAAAGNYGFSPSQFPPQNAPSFAPFPGMPQSPAPPGAGTPFGMPMGMPQQPEAMGPPTVSPPLPGGGDALELPPSKPLAQESSESGGGAVSRGGGLELPFDPFAKESLPFELPGMDKPSLELPEPNAPKRKPTPIDVGELESSTLHIPCPSGHPLEVSPELLGKVALCPICKKKFELKYDNSLEARRRQAIARRSQDNKSGQLWLAWAIFAAVLVVVGMLILVFALGK